MTASGYCLRYAAAIRRANDVLKCFDGPARTVSPGVSPPSSRPERATLIIGTEVGTISFALKNFDFERIFESFDREFFLSLSIMLMQKSPLMYFLIRDRSNGDNSHAKDARNVAFPCVQSQVVLGGFSNNRSIL